MVKRHALLRFVPVLAFGLCLMTASVQADDQVKAQQPVKPGLTTGRYVTGGIIGSVFGLGIGHAIQRRYMPMGLIFTLGEAAGYTAFFADTTFGTTTVGGFTTLRASSIGTLGAIGLIVASGLHVWEAIDLWVTGASLRDKAVADNRPRLLIVPAVLHNDAPGFTLALRF